MVCDEIFLSLMVYFLSKQARPILNLGEIEKVVDPKLGGAYDVAQLKRLAFASSLCIRSSSIWRPTMSEV